MKGFTQARSAAQRDPEQRSDGGLTLVELLVVMAMLAVMSAMILPVLASARPNNQAAQCLNNHRRLAAAWNMFPSENGDRLIPNGGSAGGIPRWVGDTMHWGTSPDPTQPGNLLNAAISSMAGYVKSASVYKCPSDMYQSAMQRKPRARSVSMNIALTGGAGFGPRVYGPARGGKYYGVGLEGTGKGVETLSELIKPGPSQTYVILDEHADSINDGTYTFEPGYASATEIWRCLPGSYHNKGVGISFADGSAEIHRWKNPVDMPTCYPVTMSVDTTWKYRAGSSEDYRWLESRMPYVEQ